MIGLWLNRDMTNDTFHKGSVVKYKNGFMEVTAVFSKTVNLGVIFYGKTRIKGVPISEVTSAHAEWHAAWVKSETYMCM